MCKPICALSKKWEGDHEAFINQVGQSLRNAGFIERANTFETLSQSMWNQSRVRILAEQYVELQ